MPVPEERDAVQRPLLRQTAYAVLCEAIVTGELAPGERLHDAQLCRWLGLSRTPIRDALLRLEDEGLVECAPQRYTRVAPLEPRDAHDTFPLLAALHGMATALAVPHLRPGDVADLRSANEDFARAVRSGKAEAAYRADDRFHGVFVARCDNPEIGRVLERLLPRVHRLELLSGAPPADRRAVAQHEAIVSRAHAGDAAGAASAARENWLGLGALLERSLAAPPAT
jgi:DNA-binding GntR family transcriptional regulator